VDGRKRVPVAGKVPNPINPQTGCAFHPRCPFAENRCRQEAPVLKQTESGLAACHAFEEGRMPSTDPVTPPQLS
jgi:peptide/nickel transport system ATP-binding protein